jgi:hypothetical protein
MKTLWVYGCSFSEPFGLGQYNAGNSILEDGTRDFGNVDYWGTHLSKKLGMKHISKSLSGIGWNYISHQVDMDILKWDKQDIIIISPSFLSRINIMEFELNNGTSVSDYVHLIKNYDEIIEYNEIRWKTKVKTLQNFGYNVFTWLVDDGRLSKKEITNLIKTPEGFINFKNWMDLHKEYWMDPTTQKYPEGDWHFNAEGHLALSEIMYEFIKKRIENCI